MSSKLQVFVSSTYTDLRAERQAAVEAILKSGHLPAGMELFAAGDEGQMEVIQRWISDSDVYMLILGGRYGTIHGPSKRSYIELEYEFAESLGKPIFAVVIKESELERRVKKIGSSVLERDEPAKLKAFRERVLSKMCGFFDDPKDIRLAVHESLPEFQRRHRLFGWVRGDTLAKLHSVSEELAEANKANNALQKEVNSLLQKLEKAKAKLANEWPEEEMREIAESLDNNKIVLSSEENGSGKSVETTVLQVVLAAPDVLITGFNNRSGMSPQDRLYFFKIFPKLEVHGLAAQEKNAGVLWRTYRMTSKGAAFLAYLDRLRRRANEVPSARVTDNGAPTSSATSNEKKEVNDSASGTRSKSRKKRG